MLFIFKKEISKLITESKTFWRIENVDRNQETEAEATVQLIWKGFKIYLVTIVATGSSTVIVTAIFTWGKTLPLESWFPKDFARGYEV